MNTNTDLIVEIIENIKELADKLKKEHSSDEVAIGQLLAYAEVLSIIKGAYAGEDLKALGLDFDIDKRYL